MNNPLDPSLRELNDCGCCSGTTAETPVAIENRPGLDAIEFRAGIHPQFKATMLAVLTAAGNPALRNLKTRDDDDLTIALLDGWATVADVLSFYSERIANESFLRTATERRSIVELARSIGYELNPGVAASTWLAFTVEDAAGAPGYANIDAGTQVQSIPGPNETPQVFETLAPLIGRKEWNELRPQFQKIPKPFVGMRELRLKGADTGLKNGDALLIVGQGRTGHPENHDWDFRRVSKIDPVADPDPEKAYTIVTLDRGLEHANRRGQPATQNAKVFALRTRANFFGYNAPDWRSMPESIKDAFDSANIGHHGSEWPNFTLEGVSNIPFTGNQAIASHTVHLDAVYPAIVSGGWVVVTTFDHEEVFDVISAAEDARANFNLTAKTTRLTLRGQNPFNARIRGASVFAQSEELPWAPEPIHDALFGDRITLDQNVLELPADRALLISGLSAADGARRVETVIVKRADKTQDGLSRLTLTEPLKYVYDPTTTLIYGNTAFATHGETTDEVLGSGDANQPHQRFVLKQTPLTYTPAANASGGESSLAIWIDDVKWREVPTLFGAGPRDRIYVVRIADDGKATVLFGDGRNGARVPTGHENVRAVYRKGIGHEGLLKAEQLTLLLTQPLGLKSVTNPEATERAADPQVFADARENAPMTVLTLDRVVSQQDYEDFARNFNGVAKALATWTWNVNSRGVFLTVAGLAGVPIAPDSNLRSDLLKSLRELGNPLLPIEVRTYTPVSFKLGGTIFVDPDRVPEKVEAAVKEALKTAFSFDARSFGQPLALSEVEAVIQNVPGVAFVDLDALYLGNTGSREHYLPAQKPEDGAAIGTVFPAELLTLDETSLSALKAQTV
jgi:predicted phage baseplate assembly protein